MIERLTSNNKHLTINKKIASSMLTRTGIAAEKYLLDGEKLWSVYNLLSGFVCVTCQRVFFTDNNLNGEKEIKSILLNQIINLKWDYQLLYGTVSISNAKNTYDLLMSKELVCKVINDINSKIIDFNNLNPKVGY